MKHFLLLITSLTLTNCSSMNRSLSLGATMGLSAGSLTGALATDSNNKTKPENVAIGAAVGLGVGLLSSYLLDKNQRQRHRKALGLPEQRIYYGDLPPNPFEIKFNKNNR